MKLNEIVVEGFADNMAAFAKGVTGYSSQDKAGRDSFTQKFTQDIYSKLVRGKRTGKMTGMDDLLGARIERSTPPAPTPTPPAPAPAPTPTPPAPAPTPTPPAPAPTPTPPAPAPTPTPPAPAATYSIPIGLPDDTLYVKGPTGWVDARTKRISAPAGIVGMLDRVLALTNQPVTEQYNKLNAVFEQMLQEAPNTRRFRRGRATAPTNPNQTGPMTPELYLTSLVGQDIGAPPTITDPKAKAQYDKQLAEIRRLIPTAANAQNRAQLKIALDKIGVLVYDITKVAQKHNPNGAL